MVDMKLIRNVAILGLIVVTLVSLRYANSQRVERKRLGSNQTALLSQLEHYKVKDSLNVASSYLLTLKSAEFERNYSRLSALVGELGIKVRRLESISQNSIESNYTISVPVVRDSSLHGSYVKPIERVAFTNNYLSFSGVISDGVFSGDISTRDTLTQIVHRVPRKFLFFRWGTRELQQEIVSSNPYTQITYSRTIKIEK